MTDHTIEAHFQVSLETTTTRNERITLAIAKALAGENNEPPPPLIAEAILFYRAITAMRIAEENELLAERKRITDAFTEAHGDGSD